MDDRIRNMAEDMVDTIAPIDDDEEEDEVDRDNADFMIRAIPMMKKALDQWRNEHPGKHCDIHAVKDDDGELRVVITPKD